MPAPLSILIGLGSIATDFLKEKAKVQELISKGPVKKAIDSTCDRFGSRVGRLRETLEQWVSRFARCIQAELTSVAGQRACSQGRRVLDYKA